VRSIVADYVSLSYLDKRNIVGEFAKGFETMIGVETARKKVRALY